MDVVGRPGCACEDDALCGGANRCGNGEGGDEIGGGGGRVVGGEELNVGVVVVVDEEVAGEVVPGRRIVGVGENPVVVDDERVVIVNPFGVVNPVVVVGCHGCRGMVWG